MRWILALSAVLILGCPLPPLFPDDDVFCTEVFVYGVNLSLADSSGAPISGATVTLTEGEFSETMEDVGAGSYVGAGERAGTYEMQVEAEGFTGQTISGITVNEDVCHVIPVVREVTLTASE